MQCASSRSIRAIRGDEARESNGAGIREEECDLCFFKQNVKIWETPKKKKKYTQTHRHTSAILLIFSPRSLSLNPKSLFNPNLTLSPSSLYAARPRCSRCCSSAVAMVDFPEADRPVNQRVKPFWLRSVQRSGCVRVEECHVMLLQIFRFSLGEGRKG